ncbi:hypothetical protein BSU04_35085 [Caballeronia sordidicola]|jgi:ribosomal protein L20|uniref:Uncharacterized protein n=1 Tax=Caballeronia sordidicola TaxID=196367 RepID=A0A226WT92_CABSO|nr:hypothetical protein BSU04_35085 [Caballeronia sordidicola]
MRRCKRHQSVQAEKKRVLEEVAGYYARQHANHPKTPSL